MKLKFLMRIKQRHSPASNPSTKVETTVIKRRTNAKTEQLDAAVAWCIQNDCWEVKPKLSKKNTQNTQVHGSMKAKGSWHAERYRG